MTGEKFGFTDDELESHPTVYRDDLLAGQVVLVSGGGRGIGKAIAWLHARLGATVVICGRDAERLAGVTAALAARGRTIQAVQANIRDPEQVASLMDKVFAEHGRLDILVNNAGGQFPQLAIDFSVKGWNAVIDTNLNGTWHMMQAAARRWRDHSSPGSIVNIVAVVERGMPGVAHTCAARAGVIYLSKTVAVEWAPLSIRVNCVAPGPIATEGMNVYPEEARRKFPQSNAMLRFGDAWDIAEAAVYMSAASGKFITGEVLTVDGGSQMYGELWTVPKPDYFA